MSFPLKALASWLRLPKIDGLQVHQAFEAKCVTMLTLFLVLRFRSWPEVAALVTTVLSMVPIGLRFGVRRGVAAAGLVDVTLLPLYVFTVIRSVLNAEGGHAEHALHLTFNEMWPTFVALIVVYALSVGGTVGLLRQRRAPDGTLQVGGVWAPRLIAALCLVGFMYVVTGDMWHVFYASGVPATERFEAALAAIVVLAYLTPLWDVLVRGWRPRDLSAHTARVRA